MSDLPASKELQALSDKIYSDLNRFAELALGARDQEKLSFPRFTMVLIRPIYEDGTLQISYIEKDNIGIQAKAEQGASDE